MVAYELVYIPACFWAQFQVKQGKGHLQFGSGQSVWHGMVFFSYCIFGLEVEENKLLHSCLGLNKVSLKSVQWSGYGLSNVSRVSRKCGQSGTEPQDTIILLNVSILFLSSTLEEKFLLYI